MVKTTAILRKSVVERRKLKKSDLESVIDRLFLDRKSVDEIKKIEQEELEYIDSKIYYFERKNNRVKVEEYKEVQKRCNQLFGVYERQRLSQ